MGPSRPSFAARHLPRLRRATAGIAQTPRPLHKPMQQTMMFPYGHYHHCGGRCRSPGSHGGCRPGGCAGTTAHFRRLFRCRAIAPLVRRGLLRGRAFPAAGNVAGPAGPDVCRRRRGRRAGVGQFHRPDRIVRRVLALFRPQKNYPARPSFSNAATVRRRAACLPCSRSSFLCWACWFRPCTWVDGCCRKQVSTCR